MISLDSFYDDKVLKGLGLISAGDIVEMFHETSDLIGLSSSVAFSRLASGGM
jgi:hypothetical protein